MASLTREQYDRMLAKELLDYLGTDAQKWASAFMHQCARDKGTITDRECIIAWFANAIEAGREAGRRS